MPDINKLPQWAQRIIRDQARRIADQDDRILTLTELSKVKVVEDRYSASPDAITVEGYALPGRQMVTVPIGRRFKGSAEEFLRVMVKKTVDGDRAVNIMYNGNGDMVIRPQASNAINVTIDYDSTGRVMG